MKSEENLEVYEGKIVKNKRKSKCAFCSQLIKSKYKIDLGEFKIRWTYNQNNYVHISCYRNRVIERLKGREETFKRIKKRIKKSINLTNKPKYKRAMLIDKLKAE